MIALKKIIVIMLVLAVAYIGVPLGYGIWNERIGVYGQITIAELPRQTAALSSTPTNLITSDTKGEIKAPEESQPSKDNADVTLVTPAVESASGESGKDIGIASVTPADENVQDKMNASSCVTADMPAEENNGSDTNSDIPAEETEETEAAEAENADQEQAQPSSSNTANALTGESDPGQSNEQTETTSDAVEEAAGNEQEQSPTGEAVVTDDTAAGEQAVADPAASGEAAA